MSILSTHRRLGKYLMALLFVSVFFLLLFLFRFELLRATGRYLISEDEPCRVQAIFVLAGGPKDRADEALELYRQGLGRFLVCTGGTVPADFEALGLLFREAEITAAYLARSGMDSSAIVLLPEGSSTLEESDLILRYCLEKKLDTVMVVSHRFHTRRIRSFFEKPFREAGIYLNIHGAPSSQYDEKRWWENEYGLLMVNNEYVKLIYYLIF